MYAENLENIKKKKKAQMTPETNKPTKTRNSPSEIQTFTI